MVDSKKHFMMKKRIKAELTNPPHKLNWLRASVLGANDGIVSIAGLVLGVAGATNSSGPAMLTAGIAGIVAGAISMGVGEFVSVSSLRDNEDAMLKKERQQLERYPQKELKELTAIYKQRGLSQKTSELVAKELSKKDVFAAHAHMELNIDPDNLINPSNAAFASASAFLIGAITPLLATVLPPVSIRVPVVFVSSLIALATIGFLSARVGGASVMKAMLRVILGGVLTMVVTFTIGKLFAVSGI